jgi:flagellar biosynthesis protein FlhF
MNLVTIVAESAAEALAEVHRRLGPEAIVVNVRRTAAPGLSRMWKKPRIELQAALPTPTPKPAPVKPRNEALTELAKKVDELKLKLSQPSSASNRSKMAGREALERLKAEPLESRELMPEIPDLSKREVDLGKMLENLGVLPLHVQWLVDQVRARQGGRQGQNLREEFAMVQEFLLQHWAYLAGRTEAMTQSPRILVGTPGVGKTTCLCKWLTQEVLLQNHTARVWRLDGHTANTAEFLSIHGEILGVPVERVWTKDSGGDSPQVQFVDLPGVSVEDAQAMATLTAQLAEFEAPKVFLVLNAAYDLSHLLAHVRLFSVLPLAGLILTHLDEDKRWSKFWNLLLGTKLPVLYLSGGQNIPGYFTAASPQSLFDVSSDQALD